MILDYEKMGREADAFEVIDLLTGNPLPMDVPYCDLFYADDGAGIIRMYQRDSIGNFLLASEDNPTVPLADQEPIAMKDRVGKILNPVVVAWKEEKRAIKIIAKDRVMA